MNIVPIQDVWFDDAATSAMGQAFDQARKSLRNFGSASTVREIIATRIIAAAKNDERDPARLHEQALIPFGIENLSMQVSSVDRAPAASACARPRNSVILSPVSSPGAGLLLTRPSTRAEPLSA
jgi:hypothetical protein